MSEQQQTEKPLPVRAKDICKSKQLKCSTWHLTALKGKHSAPNFGVLESTCVPMVNLALHTQQPLLPWWW
jgi:hypothetical protein